MIEPPFFTHDESQLTEAELTREDVLAETLALLSAWIEAKRLLVDDREGVGGIDFSRMDTKVMVPLPRIATFSPVAPTSAEPGIPPGGTASTCCCTRMWKKIGT